MPLNITETINIAKALNEQLKAAVLNKEYIIQTETGPVATGQLVNAASFSGQVVALLEGHIAAEENAIKAGKEAAAEENAIKAGKEAAAKK